MADRIIVLNEGRIEQIGAPSEVYNHPASTFVASFIGAPPMNLLPATVDGDQGVTLADGTVLSARAPQGSPATVLAGVRPEDVVLGSGDIPFTVDIIEELGALRLLHGTLGGAAFSVSIGKDEEAQTGPVYIALKQGALHIFDPETERRV